MSEVITALLGAGFVLEHFAEHSYAVHAMWPWLEEQGRMEDFVDLPTGGQGDFDEEEEIDLATLVPLVAKPSSPGNVVPVEEVAGTKLAQVCIGSSVNSSYEDLALAGSVLRGTRISDELFSATATPGSRQILDQITALEDLRNYLPTHYGTAWAGLLADQIDWGEMTRGAFSAVSYATAFFAVAVWRFGRKDITS